MTKSSRRAQRAIDEAALTEYASQAAENPVPTVDAPSPSVETAVEARPDLPRHRQRAKTGTKGPGASFRYNESQGRLLDYAVAMEDKKKQELLEELIWPVLEERYGSQVPLEK